MPKIAKKTVAPYVAKTPKSKAESTIAPGKAAKMLGISVPLIQRNALNFHIEGIGELLVKGFSDVDIEKIEAKQQAPQDRQKETLKPRNPDQERENARLLDHNGRDCVKSIWFKKGMAAMGPLFGIPSSVIQQSVWIDGYLIPIMQNGKKKVTYIPERHMGKIGPWNKRVAYPIYRPGYMNWSCEIRVEFDAVVLTPDTIAALLSHAGVKNGIGEFRVERGGDYGRFEVSPARAR